jgi:hypothetical protein
MPAWNFEAGLAFVIAMNPLEEKITGILRGDKGD